MTKYLTFIFTLLLSVACIKTADQVHREKRFDSMTEQLRDSQGLVADLIAQMKDMQGQLDRMNGRLEVLEHRQKDQVKSQDVTNMNETLALLKSKQETDSQQLTQIQAELKEQRGFIEKVTQSLESLGKNSAKPQKKNAKAELNSALDLVKNNKYSEARKELEALIDHPDLSAGDHNKVFHGLGRVEFYTKSYEKALVYFSKVFSKYPKSSMAPSSLLFIAKSLDKMKKKDEAKEAFAKVVEDYPNTSEANEAKKEL
jgi:TolA-binding protein